MLALNDIRHDTSRTELIVNASLQLKSQVFQIFVFLGNISLLWMAISWPSAMVTRTWSSDQRAHRWSCHWMCRLVIDWRSSGVHWSPSGWPSTAISIVCINALSFKLSINDLYNNYIYDLLTIDCLLRLSLIFPQ